MNEEIKQIDRKLQELRKKWIEDPAKRIIIKRQARSLEIAKEMINSKHFTQ